MIAEVAPEIRVFGSKIALFSYLVPEEMKTKIRLGSIVLISFGKRKIRGIVFELKEETMDNLKTITAVNENISLEKAYLETARWISSYYLCSLGEAASLFLPPEMKRPRKVVGQAIKIKPNNVTLADDQEKVYLELLSKLKNPQKPSLLLGVTGSGKTEIYLELTKKTIEDGKQVIILVPEIMLTPQTLSRFQSMFGDEIAIMHSGLSLSEKYACYTDFYFGNKKIVVGPRSALLIPSQRLGLIIIDEEQEDAYKQDHNPRYHSVDLAKEIAKNTHSLLLLGSATPRVETYYETEKGEMDLSELKERFNSESLPKAQIIDLKEEHRKGNYSIFSESLVKELREVMDNKKQALLFLNRRGMSTFISCRDCGEVLLCPNCQISLAYHLDEKNGYLNCHHCDYKSPVPSRCPECQSTKIKFFGTGIEKVIAELNTLFPKARTFRADSASLQRKGDYELFDKMLRNHEIDIVAGTQIVAKGLDIDNIDMVGVVSADTSLHLPHFRANEKTFQIITQVSGRSGRKASTGKTIIQSYWPENSSIQFASNHDYKGFFKLEIEERKKFHYPPFVHILRIVSEDKDKKKASEKINILTDIIKKAGYGLLGPGPCFYQKLYNKYRFHVIIKLDRWPDNQIAKIKAENDGFVWDIDPVSLL